MADGGMTVQELYDRFGDTASPRELLYDWMGANTWLFQHINQIHGNVYDALMLFITSLGDRHNFPYYLMFLAVFVILSALYKQVAKRAGVKQYFISWLGVFAVLLVGFIADTMVTRTAKNFFHFPRPYVALANDPYSIQHPPVVLERTESPEDDYRSFPSGHVAFVTMMVVALWPMLSGGFRWLGGGLIFAEAWSRVAVGKHFPADAVGAFLLTLLTITLVRILIYWVFRKVLRLNC